MKTITILMLGIATAMPVSAQTFLQSRTVPAKVRYGYVYDYARRACPASEAHVFKQGTFVGYIGNVADRAAMSSDERSLLFLMCDMYRHGHNQDLPPTQ